MERRAVVVALLDETDEVRNGVGGFVLEQFEDDVAFFRGEFDAGQVVGLRFLFANRLFSFSIGLVLFQSQLVILAVVG